MSQRLVPALLAVMAVALVWLAFTLWEAGSRRRRAALEHAFRRYAAARRLRLISGEDPGPSQAHGEVQGVEIDLQIERADTRVTGTLPGVAPEFVMVIQRRGEEPAGDVAGLVEAKTGNKAFDAAFALLSNEPDLARSLLDRRLAQVVLGFPKSFVELCAHGKRFALAWPGMETDARVLDAAIEVVFTACRRRA